MRILLLTSEYPPFAWGGLGRYAHEIVRAGADGLRFDVLNVPGYCLESAPAAFECIAADEGGSRVWHVLDPQYCACFADPPDHAAYLARARVLADWFHAGGGGGYDAVYAQDFYNVAIAYFLQAGGCARRLVAACHLPLSARFSYFDKAVSEDFQQRLESALVRVAAKIAVPSEFTRRSLARIYSVPPGRVVVCPLGVGPGSEPAGAGGPWLRLLSVGRFTDQKGFQYLAPVLGGLRARGIRARLTLVGRGSRENAVLARLRAAGVIDDVDHLRGVGAEAVFGLYAGADVYLSTSAHETFGLAILEAMACGCVPVCFAVGAIPELVEHGVTGYLVEPNDVDGLLERIAALAADPTLRRAMAANCRQRAAGFTWQRHLRLLEQAVFREG